MWKLILYFFTLVSLSSCLSRRFAINPFIEKGYCFKDTLSGLEKKIKLNGYYEYTHEYTTEGVMYRNKKLTNVKEKSQSIVKFFFYDNGLVMLNFRLNDSTSGLLARYTIYNDTIKTIYPQIGGQTPCLIYRYFKILDDSTLDFLGSVYDNDLDSVGFSKFKNGNADDSKSMGEYSKVRFVPSNYVPDYKTERVLKEKWFWCNEEKYNKFMQQLNNTK